MSSLIAKEESKSSFEPIADGCYVAVCINLIDLGIQHNEMYNKFQHKIMLTWELIGETIEVEKDGKVEILPRITSKEYTLSLDKKAYLRNHLEAWRGRAFTQEELDGFDVVNIIGKPCQLQIINETNAKGKTYANISAVMSMPKGVEAPKPLSEILLFELDRDHLDMIPAMPEWIQNKIKNSETYKDIIAGQDGVEAPQASANDYALDPAELEEIPF